VRTVTRPLPGAGLRSLPLAMGSTSSSRSSSDPGDHVVCYELGNPWGWRQAELGCGRPAGACRAGGGPLGAGAVFRTLWSAGTPYGRRERRALQVVSRLGLARPCSFASALAWRGPGPDAPPSSPGLPVGAVLRTHPRAPSIDDAEAVRGRPPPPCRRAGRLAAGPSSPPSGRGRGTRGRSPSGGTTLGVSPCSPAGGEPLAWCKASLPRCPAVGGSRPGEPPPMSVQDGGSLPPWTVSSARRAVAVAAARLACVARS